MKIVSFSKIFFKDLFLSLFFSSVLFLFLRYVFYLDETTIVYIVSLVFFLIFVFSVSMSFVMFKLKEKIDLLNENLEKLSKFDDMTDIYKRLYFMEMIKKYFDISKRKNLPLSVMVIDIDNFKFFNKTYGHRFADLILKEVASKIKSQIRGMDIIGRFGGDEFIIVSFSTKKDFLSLAKRIKKDISDIKLEEKKINVSVSIGISELQMGDDLDKVIKRAEEALILAKQKGGDRIDYLEHFLLFE